MQDCYLPKNKQKWGTPTIFKENKAKFENSAYYEAFKLNKNS